MPSGAQSVVYFKWEKTYGTIVDGTPTAIPFGYGTKITSLERNNNLERIYGLGSRTAQSLLEKQFGGTWGIETVYSDPRILWAIVGDGSTAPSASVPPSVVDRYLGTDYEDTAATPDPGVNGYTMSTIGAEAKIQPSFKLYNSIDASTDYVATFDGCMVNTATISASVNEPASLKADGFFKTETLATSGLFTNPTYVASPVSFSNGVLQFPNTGTTIINSVQNFELTINNNVDQVYGLGSRTPQTKVEKNREYEIRASVYFDDPQKFLAFAFTGASSGTAPGAISNASLQLVFTNTTAGVKSTSLEATVWNFNAVKINTESLPQSADAPIMEDVVFYADTCTCKVLNSTFGNFF